MGWFGERPVSLVDSEFGGILGWLCFGRLWRSSGSCLFGMRELVHVYELAPELRKIGEW